MRRHFLALCLLLALLGAGCTQPAPTPEPAQPSALGEELGRLADAQLGLLSDVITAEERGRALLLLEQLEPLRRARLEAGRWEKSAQEEQLLRRLNRLYERWTTRYLGDGGPWGYSSPPERVLAGYRVVEGNALRPADVAGRRGTDQEADADLWARIVSLLPDGALERFTRFTVFTDGPEEMLAYVMALDSSGSRWELAVDPADAEDEGWFTETLLHEYCHALTLNDSQVVYTHRQTVDTYNEAGMVARSGSYLDDFYQEFWTDLLDDRLANPNSYGFFLRHEEDFITAYASTDPSEDIAESFTYFLLWPPLEGDAVWEQKLRFFYDYPELTQFRDQVRAHLGLDAEEPWKQTDSISEAAWNRY